MQLLHESCLGCAVMQLSAIAQVHVSQCSLGFGKRNFGETKFDEIQYHGMNLLIILIYITNTYYVLQDFCANTIP